MVAQNLLRKWLSARPVFRLRSSTGVIYASNPKRNTQTLVRPSRLPVPLQTAIIFASEYLATLNETCLLADRTPMTIGKFLVVLRKK